MQDPNLCSHLYALCFIAQSLFDDKQLLQAKRCTQVCPHLSVFQIAKIFIQPDPSIYDNSIIDSDIPENVVLGMNMNIRFD